MRSREFFGYRVIAVDPFEALANRMLHLFTHLPQACAMALMTPDGKVDIKIVVNEAITFLPMRVQEAVIAHEIGHIELGHLSEEVRKQHPGGGVVNNLAFELAADMYAARQGYAQELCALLQQMNQISPHRDCDIRVEALLCFLREEEQHACK